MLSKKDMGSTDGNPGASVVEGGGEYVVDGGAGDEDDSEVDVDSGYVLVVSSGGL